MLLSRIVWSEGMHLAQHHFQTQSRYFEDLVAFTLSSLFYRCYGFAGLERFTHSPAPRRNARVLQALRRAPAW